MRRLVILGAAMLATATAAAADPGVATMRQAADIRSGENVTRWTPRDGGALIELAQAYIRAGRNTDALTAYRAALARDNEMMEKRNGDAIWSHEVARIALANESRLTSR